ncbi:MAG: DUF4386 domain-containing protein [Bacteroidetes bacterium]|nr:DUF4386 domain-containing protein [Bacteroidota bacterium]
MNKLIHKRDRKKAVITGIFFITATLTAIIGFKLYDPLLEFSTPGAGAEHAGQIALGALFELVLCCANIGTAVMLYPFLRRYNESMGLAYVVFRLLEVVFIMVGILSMLALVSLSVAYVNHPGQDMNDFMMLAGTLTSIHEWTFILGPHFMLGINTFVYSYVLCRTEIVPVKIALTGMIGAVLIFAAAVMEVFGLFSYFSIQTVFMALPVAVYEMVLAVWLIRRGFNQEALEKTEEDCRNMLTA